MIYMDLSSRDEIGKSWKTWTSCSSRMYLYQSISVLSLHLWNASELPNSEFFPQRVGMTLRHPQGWCWYHHPHWECPTSVAEALICNALRFPDPKCPLSENPPHQWRCSSPGRSAPGPARTAIAESRTAIAASRTAIAASWTAIAACSQNPATFFFFLVGNLRIPEWLIRKCLQNDGKLRCRNWGFFYSPTGGKCCSMPLIWQLDELGYFHGLETSMWLHVSKFVEASLKISLCSFDVDGMLWHPQGMLWFSLPTRWDWWMFTTPSFIGFQWFSVIPSSAPHFFGWISTKQSWPWDTMMYWNNHDDLGIPPWLSHPQPSHQEANSEAQAQGHHSKGKDGLSGVAVENWNVTSHKSLWIWGPQDI